MAFYLTTNQKDHDHVLWLPDGPTLSGLTGITSQDNDHVHTVIPAPAPDQLPTLSPAPTDGHTHDFFPYPVKEPQSRTKGTKRDRANRVLGIWREMRDFEEKPRKKARESYRFYYGEQYDEQDRVNTPKGRPLLTINETRPKINILRGYAIQNRMDIVYRPVESNDQLGAQIYTSVVKNITERSGLPFEEGRQILDTLVAGRGVLHVYMDFDQDPEGNIRIEYFPWDQVWYSPHRNPDLSDCDYEVRARWVTMEQARRMFPELREELESYFDDLQTRAKDPVGHRLPGHQYDMEETDGLTLADYSELLDITRKSVRVVEMWERTYERAQVAVNALDDEYVDLTGWRKADVNRVRTLPGFALVPRAATRMHVTRLVGDTLVDEDYPDLADQAFHTFPTYCYLSPECGFHGLVEDAKDPQRMVNKLHSQQADITNKIAVNSWFFDRQSFANKAEIKKFLKLGTVPGAMFEVRNTAHLPVRIEPPGFPVQITQTAELMSQKMREVMNTNLDLAGMESDATSGVAIVERKRQALIGNSFVFDNHSMNKKRLGHLLLRMIKKYYSPQRIYRILMGDNENRVPGLDQLSPEEVMQAIVAADPAKFDMVVDESPFNSTMRRANFIQWSQMAANGVPVDGETLVELSDLPYKDRVVERMNQQQQAAAEAENRKYDSEEKKTLMAQVGSTNPELLVQLLMQKMGMQPDQGGAPGGPVQPPPPGAPPTGLPR